ncbi:MAG: hypothetical protein KA015_04710 [Spirochaetes bacterium]|nr:hypothetical protein [Spirochaetota bacterium]
MGIFGMMKNHNRIAAKWQMNHSFGLYFIAKNSNLGMNNQYVIKII